MGLDYALVHLKYTIPPAIVLTLLYIPLATKLCLYKILFLIAIAVVSTIPWDSYLIRHRIWSYPPNAIIGPTLYSIPAEEVFFFCIQTYLTSLLYLLINKPIFHSVYICGHQKISRRKYIGQRRNSVSFAVTASLCVAIALIFRGGKGLYLGLIIAWAGPFILLLWNLAYQLLIELPTFNVLGPILLPTFYLWIVDTIALKRGTWVIESGTKLNWHLWSGLDIEEAIFFLITNVLVVFGLVAFDNAVTILQTFPSLFSGQITLPSPLMLIKALLLPVREYDEERIDALTEALGRLRSKSRSFYLASATFQGRIRIDLILLYSFCRVADDLVDEESCSEAAKAWIDKLRAYLDLRYSRPTAKTAITSDEFVMSSFPKSAQKTLRMLPTHVLSPGPLYELLNGFETDLAFSAAKPSFPIKDESDLDLYGARVAGTVAEACLELVYHHCRATNSPPRQVQIQECGRSMGIALQYINIARDIVVDASNGRVYIPTSWLWEEDLDHAAILATRDGEKVEKLRQRLLARAMVMYDEAKQAIEDLPAAARAPMRVAVESYVEIGRVLKEPSYTLKAGRATVPKVRRLRVAWEALRKG